MLFLLFLPITSLNPTQSTYVLQYQHPNGTVLTIYMGDKYECTIPFRTHLPKCSFDYSWNDNGPGSVQAATYVWLPIEVCTFRIHISSTHANTSYAYQNLDTTPTMVFHETWAIADY
jgi:hypothetical protein